MFGLDAVELSNLQSLQSVARKAAISYSLAPYDGRIKKIMQKSIVESQKILDQKFISQFDFDYVRSRSIGINFIHAYYNLVLYLIHKQKNKCFRDASKHINF